MGSTEDDEDRELLRASLETAMKIAKRTAKKKFTPEKISEIGCSLKAVMLYGCKKMTPYKRRKNIKHGTHMKLQRLAAYKSYMLR